MAGHSQFKNIMHRKGAQDAKRAKLFNKLAREITVAVKSGLPDPAANPRLKSAIASARAQNMPRERIERAIKSGTGNADTASYEEIRYEGYGPGGVAVIVEALTDNRNRTAPDVRAAFAKQGGSLGETNSVSFMFARLGIITYPVSAGPAETVFEQALEAGASDVVSTEEGHEITTEIDSFASVRDHLEGKFGPAETARLGWKPLSVILVPSEHAESLMELIDVLEDNDDVQMVYTNADFSQASAGQG